MARNGRRADARDLVDEMNKRLVKLKGPFRKEAIVWRDFAAGALTGG